MRKILVALLLTAALPSLAQQGPKPDPTFSNVSYGSHEQQRFDFYQADVDAPAPLAVYIHGGGFRGGSEDGINVGTLRALLEAGIHVAAVEYRFVQHQPLPTSFYDALRALQTIRSKAAEWKIDKTRVGAFGGSAGAQISMWLAFSPEMAKPESDDPIERESSRLTAVAPNGGQINMDMTWWRAHIPEFTASQRSREELYGKATDDQIQAIVDHIAALRLVSADDPPIHMTYRMAPDDPVPAENPYGWKIHHVNFGLALDEKAKELGVESYLQYPGRTPRYRSAAQFLIAKLKH